MKKKYVTTKEECEKKISENGNVCEYCGRFLEAIETTDNAHNPTYWSGCFHVDSRLEDGDYWGVFTTGVNNNVFELAKKLVVEEGSYYEHIEKSEYSRNIIQRTYWFEQQTAGWARLIAKIKYLENHPARQTKEEFINNEYF